MFCTLCFLSLIMFCFHLLRSKPLDFRLGNDKLDRGVEDTGFRSVFHPSEGVELVPAVLVKIISCSPTTPLLLLVPLVTANQPEVVFQDHQNKINPQIM